MAPRDAAEHLERAFEAEADALKSLGLDRRTALWRIAGLESAPLLPLFEGQIKTARPTTIKAMVTALEEGGIEFPASGGVRLLEEVTSIRRFAGKDFLQSQNGDVYASVRKSGSEILTCSADDTLWQSDQASKANRQFAAWRKKLAINEKILIAEGDNFFNLPRQHYRSLPRDVIGKLTYVIYADKIAFTFWKKEQSIILRNVLIVETFRQQFRHLWRLGKQV